jgi:hypothetical protein
MSGCARAEHGECEEDGEGPVGHVL